MEIKLNRNEIDYIVSNLTYKESLSENKNKGLQIIKKLQKALKPPIKIKSRKAKGRNLQQWVCQKIANILEIKYEQQNDQCPIHSREMGQSGTDIILRGNVLKQFPFSIECKSGKTLNLTGTIRQVKNNKIENTDWIIVYKGNYKKSIVIMEWDCFEKFYKKGEK